MNGGQTPQDPRPQSVDWLSRLLAYLYPDPAPDILTLADFRLRYRLTGLGPLAVGAIQQAQRINKAIGKFDDIGLCEFHIGLIYLHWHDYQGAATQFKEARQQWSFADKTMAICLSHFAQGLAEHHRYAYEAALTQYGKAEHVQERIRFDSSPNNRDEFLQKLDENLQKAQKAAREVLWEPTATLPVGEPTEAEEGETAVPLPIVSSLPQTSDSKIPIPGHAKTHQPYTWYRVHTRQPDRIFADIKEDGYLLVHHQTGEHSFKEGELIVIESDDPSASIVLEPFLSDGQEFPRICLARAEFEGSFTIEAGRAQLSSNLKQIPVNHTNLRGYVIGLWLEVSDFEILGSEG